LAIVREIESGQWALACTKVSVVPHNAAPLPDFTRWPSFPFEGDLRVKDLAPPVAVEPPRSGEDASDCVACNTSDDAYIWFSERWRVRAMDRPTGLPMVLILECRSHLDLGDLPNLLAAELGVMTVRLERAIRSLDGVARVHVNRWGDGSAHLHMWFLACRVRRSGQRRAGPHPVGVARDFLRFSDCRYVGHRTHISTELT